MIGHTLKTRLRREISKHPALYIPMRRMARPGTVLSADTNLVVEGYPRCANTWVEHLVRHLGPTLRIAHHSHSVAHVEAALARHVPVVLLCRPPREAVLSRLAMRPDDPISYLKDYIVFYRPFTRARRQLLRCPFEIATRHPQALVHEIQKRFDLGLQTHVGAADLAAVRRLMNQSALERRGSNQTSAIPNPEDGSRAQARSRALQQLEQQRVKSVLRDAEELFETVSSDV